jgi:transglutaminase-like putative cysteine protease
VQILGRLVAAVIVLAGARAGADELTRGALGPRTVRFTYEARFAPPAGAGVVEVWLPLPREDDQTIRDLRLTGDPRPSVLVLHPSGDRVAYVRVERPTGAVTLGETATVARREVEAVPADAQADGVVDGAAFADSLGSSPFVLVNDDVRKIARETTARARGTVAGARAIYDWVYDHMQYDKSVPGFGLGDVPYCLKVGKGNCTDFHTLFIALARTSGIPARFSMGFPLAYGDGRSAPAADQTVPGYHCWAEFWAPGAGWVPVDISEARKHPELKDYFFGHLSGNRILFSRARDFVLDPDATTTRRNYLIYPVVRVDGKDATGVEWSFKYSDLVPG